jgi:hypothetical protein
VRSSHRKQDRDCFTILMQAVHPKNARAGELRDCEPQMANSEFVCQHAKPAVRLPSHRMEPFQLPHCGRCLFLADQVDPRPFALQSSDGIAPVRTCLLRHVRHSVLTAKREHQARIGRIARCDGLLNRDLQQR